MQAQLAVMPPIPSQKPKEIVVVGTPTKAPTEHISFVYERITFV